MVSDMAVAHAACRIGEWAKVQLEDGTVHQGIVHTVDPESGHVVLLRPVDGQPLYASPLVLFGSAITSVAQASRAQSTVWTGMLIKPSSADSMLDAQTVERRRLAVRATLQHEFVPFEELENGQFCVLGCLNAAPPYTRRSCRCENEIVLERVAELLERAAKQVDGKSDG